MAAKQQDAAAEVVLLNDETSRALREAAAVEGGAHGQARAPRHADRRPEGIAATGVALKGGTRVAAIDRAARMIVTDAVASASATTRSCSPPDRSTEVLPMFPAGRAGI